MKRIQLTILLILILSILPLYSQPMHESEGEDHHGEFHDMDREDQHHDGDRIMDRKLPPRRIKAILKHLKNEHPNFYKELTDLRETNPEIFNRNMQKFKKFFRNHKKEKSDKNHIIEIFDIELEIDLLIEKYIVETKEDKKKVIKKELLSKMSSVFDKKEEMKLKMIKKIEKSLVEKRKAYELRKSKKDKLISNELDKILLDREMMESMK